MTPLWQHILKIAAKVVLGALAAFLLLFVLPVLLLALRTLFRRRGGDGQQQGRQDK